MKKFVLFWCTVILHFSNIYAERIQFHFSTEDFEFYELQTTFPLKNNAKLIVIAPTSFIEAHYECYEDCSIILSRMNMSEGYIDRFPNYITLSCVYLAPYGKKIRSYHVDDMQAQIIKSDVYIPSTICLESASRDNNGQPVFGQVDTSPNSYWTEFIDRYVDYRYPQEYSAIECTTYNSGITCHFAISPFYVIGSDLYLITSYLISLELDDFPFYESPITDYSFLFSPFYTKTIINSENIEEYKTHTFLSNINTESLIMYNKDTQNIIINNDRLSNVSLFDIYGNLLINSKHSSIDISNFPKGIYIICASLPNKVMIEKVIK